MAKKAKLHEILAVEKSLETAYDKSVKEAQNTFSNKGNHLTGFVKNYFPLDDAHAHMAGKVDGREMEETIPRKLGFVFKHFTKYLDGVLQKERTNQDARADIELADGTVLATDVPATFLLGLENKLRKIRALVDEAPTLPAGTKWVKDAQRGDDVYITDEPEKADRTEKVHCHKVMHPGSEHHPAQIAEWSEQRKIGHYETTTWTGRISPHDKSVLLGRVDDLLRAVKKARQRANSTEIVKVEVGKKLTGFLLTGATS
jgi:hypothetical protein